MDVYTQNAHLTLFKDAQSLLFNDKRTGCFTCHFDRQYYEDPHIKLKIDQLLRSVFAHSKGTIYWLSSGDLFIFFSECERYLVDCFKIFAQTLKRIKIKKLTSDIFDLRQEWKKFTTIYIEKMKEIDIDFLTSHTESTHLFNFHHNQQARNVRNRPQALILTDGLIQENITFCLKEVDFDYVKASSIPVAFEKYTENAPNIVIMDMDLVKNEALSLTQEIYSIDPDCFILLLGTNAPKEEILPFIQRGAKGYINKPFTRNIVLECLRKYEKERMQHIETLYGMRYTEELAAL